MVFFHIPTMWSEFAFSLSGSQWRSIPRMVAPTTALSAKWSATPLDLSPHSTPTHRLVFHVAMLYWHMERRNMTR